MVRTLLSLAALSATLVCAGVAFAQHRPAFPGADGPGSHATGGRDGEVYHVTNLNDSGPGSLRDAVSQGDRTVVFDVAGLIFLEPAKDTQGWLRSGASNLTIAGQTAPHPGITIAGQGTKFTGSNVIMRHLKIRPGKHQLQPGVSTHDGISNYLQHSIIDHVSVSWADDEALSATDLVDHTTVQYCLIGESLYYNLSDGKPHAYGMLINSEVADTPISFHHNLLVHVQSRLPRIQCRKPPGAVINWSNNVVYNWTGNAAYSGADEPTRTNFVGNYYIAGPNTNSGSRTFYSPDEATRIYYSNNYRDMDTNGRLDGADPGADVFIEGAVTLNDAPFGEVAMAEVDPAESLVDRVVARAGAYWWNRDRHDARMVADLVNQTGNFVPDPSAVGGWDKRSATRPAEFDPDGDGMATKWELAHGLDPTQADNSGDANRDGYTNLENYLNDLGAFPLLRAARWQGGDGRYADATKWHRGWLPSRFDQVEITGSTVAIDSPGNWASSVRLTADDTATTTVDVESGWWRIVGDVEIGDRSQITHTGGTVRLDGALRIGPATSRAGYSLAGGVLYAREINVLAGGELAVQGGTLHAGQISARRVRLSGGRLAPGTGAAVEQIAGCLGERALVPPTASTIGRTSIEGDLDLTGGVLEIGIENGESVDSVVVDGHLELGGKLDVQLSAGFAPPPGATFTIAKANSVAGKFAQVPEGFSVAVSKSGHVVLSCESRVGQQVPGGLQLVAPLGLTGAANVPVDILPSLVFDRPISAGTTGTIRLYRGDGTLLSTIDLAAEPRRRVGNDKLHYFPVVANGSTATLLFDRGLVDYGETYYATLDAGVIVSAKGQPWPGVNDPQTLRFTTRRNGPANSAVAVTVNPDGSGDFCTVQGALDHVAAHATNRVVVQIADGEYDELVYVASQSGPVTLRGESRAGTVIRYANNARFNAHSRASFRNRAHDLTIENLTLVNTTPPGGSQAEAFMSQGHRVVVRNCTLASYQDTVRVDRSAYFENCRIAGDVDFVWGDGVGYFDRCELHSRRKGFVVQARNSEAAQGFVFKACRLTGDPAAAGSFLARIHPVEYPGSEVVLLRCAMGDHIAPVGWQLDGWQLDGPTPAETLRFYEWQSTDLDGRPLDVTSRHPASEQLTNEQAAAFLDPAAVLGFDPSTR